MDLFNSKRLGLAVVLSLIAVACAAPQIPNETGGDEETGEEPVIAGNKKKSTPTKPGTTQTTDSNTPAPTGTPTPAPSGTQTPTPVPLPGGDPAPTGACAATADGEACFQCCDQASGGELAKADEAFFTCACDAQCATQCGANFCAGQEPSAACETCLTNTCEAAASAACTSAACKAGEQCMQTSCAGKQ
jgi:hypothetical protein